MVNQQKVIEILRNIGETIEKEKLFLTELDNVIGDGDHGINLSRGFQEVEKKLDTLADKDIGTIFKDGWNDTCIYGGRRIRTTLWDCIYEGRAIDGRKRCGGHQ